MTAMKSKWGYVPGGDPFVVPGPLQRGLDGPVPSGPHWFDLVQYLWNSELNEWKCRGQRERRNTAAAEFQCLEVFRKSATSSSVGNLAFLKRPSSSSLASLLIGLLALGAAFLASVSLELERSSSSSSASSAEEWVPLGCGAERDLFGGGVLLVSFDPLPGEEFMRVVGVCNQRKTMLARKGENEQVVPGPRTERHSGRWRH